MNHRVSSLRRIACLSILTTLSLSSLAAAEGSSILGPRARILQSIDEDRTVTLRGNVHPLAGSSRSTAVDQNTPMEHMILTLKADAAQDAQLTQLIEEQNNPKSAHYHRFLSPADFGARFGVAAADIEKISSWLQGHGFILDEVSPSHRAITFSGTSGQIAEAFKTEIRHYEVSGQNHFANATDPQIPEALADVVGGVVKMNNFQHERSIVNVTALNKTADPKFDVYSSHYVVPADYGTIYDINPLYSAGVNGNGQAIAVIARSNISLSDVQSFRSMFGLTANNPQIVLAGSDPGVVQGDSTETTLDTEWSGAVAPGATIKVVVASSTNTADGIDISALYAVNNNVAPVLSLSYGSCEASMGVTELGFYNALWQQAAAEGITVLVAAGDSGAAGCYAGATSVASGKSVNGLCSSPYATCVGGTEFVEGNNPGQYWQAGNNSVYGSAIGYIPETVWNESGANGGLDLWAGSGGVSTVYSKPSWQTGTGVPADGFRDVPDVSLTAATHDGYVIMNGGSLAAVAGTSASTPSFAALVALVNQKNNGAQGLVNANLYALASNQANGGAAIFHDVTTGNNSVPGVTGFSAGTGYDPASGLGSVDAALLVNHWNDAANNGAATLSVALSSSAVNLQSGQSVQLTVTTTGNSALGSAVTLGVSGLPSGLQAVLGANTIAAPGSGSVALTITARTSVAPGTYNLTLTAQAGSKTATANVAVTVANPSFTLAVSNPGVSSKLGGNAAVIVGVTPQNGFNSAVALSISGVPAGVSASFAPANLNGAAPATSVLNLVANHTAIGGTYNLTITATGGGVSRSVTVAFTVVAQASCTLVTNPGSLNLIAGHSANVQVSCGSVQGSFTSPMTLAIAGAPKGMTLKAASKITAGVGTTLSVATAANIAVGNYSLMLTVAAPGFVQTLKFPVSVPAVAGFKVTTPTSVAVKKGGAGKISVSSTHFGTFKANVSLTCTGLPKGVTAAFSKSTVSAPGDGSVSLALSAGSQAKSGTYNVSITGTGSGVTVTNTVALTIQ